MTEYANFLTQPSSTFSTPSHRSSMNDRHRKKRDLHKFQVVTNGTVQVMITMEIQEEIPKTNCHLQLIPLVALLVIHFLDQHVSVLEKEANQDFRESLDMAESGDHQVILDRLDHLDDPVKRVMVVTLARLALKASEDLTGLKGSLESLVRMVYPEVEESWD